jgi:hypothetical protein
MPVIRLKLLWWPARARATQYMYEFGARLHPHTHPRLTQNLWQRCIPKFMQIKSWLRVIFPETRIDFQFVAAENGVGKIAARGGGSGVFLALAPFYINALNAGKWCVI